MSCRSDGTFALWVRGKEVRGTYTVLDILVHAGRGAEMIQVSGRRFGPLGLHNKQPWPTWTVVHIATGLKLYTSSDRRLAEDALRMLLGSGIRWSSIKTIEQSQRPRTAKRGRRVLDYIYRRHIYLRVLLRRQDRRRPRRGRRIRRRGGRARV